MRRFRCLSRLWLPHEYCYHLSSIYSDFLNFTYAKAQEWLSMKYTFLFEGHLCAINSTFDASRSFCPGSIAFRKFCLSSTFLREYLFFRGNSYRWIQRLKDHKFSQFGDNFAWTCKQPKVCQHSSWLPSSYLYDYLLVYQPTSFMHSLDTTPCKLQE